MHYSLLLAHTFTAHTHTNNNHAPTSNKQQGRQHHQKLLQRANCQQDISIRSLHLRRLARKKDARCAMGDDICLSNHQASQGVESMNFANNPARARTAVDILNATLLIIRHEGKRGKLSEYVYFTFLHLVSYLTINQQFGHEATHFSSFFPIFV